MSFGTSAASYVGITTPGGIVQQNFGIWTGTAMAVTLPSATAPSSIIALIVAGNTTVSTPIGWTLRQSQVNFMGHYLFTQSGGGSSWNITTANGSGTWYIAEISGGTYDTSASDNDPSGSSSYMTPALTPTVGERLLIASLGSVNGGATVCTVSDWTDSFVEVADVCNPTADYAMQGVAARTVTADGVSSYSTGVTYSMNGVYRSAIIAAFTQ